jgi:hypothetical protein
MASIPNFKLAAPTEKFELDLPSAVRAVMVAILQEENTDEANGGAYWLILSDMTRGFAADWQLV